jgi:NTE family protein
MTIDGHRYVDGTVRSPTNADVAAGSDRVLVVAPMPDIRGLPGAGIEEQTAPVRASGQVVVITPNERSRAAMGRDMLSLSRQGSIATAGLAQAADVLDAVGEVWRT